MGRDHLGEHALTLVVEVAAGIQAELGVVLVTGGQLLVEHDHR